MKLIFTLLSLLVCSLSTTIFAQKNAPLSTELSRIAEGDMDWMRFNKDANITASRLVGAEKTYLGLRDEDALILKKSKTDNLGIQHSRYIQYYNNIPVEGSEFIIHEKEGLVKSATGGLVQGLEISTIPSLSESQAVNKALAHIDATRYMWENEDVEQLLKDLKNDASATFFPKAELVWVSPNFDTQKENYRLVYRLEINSIKPMGREYVYVDAQNGNIVTTLNLLRHTNCNHVEHITNNDVSGTGVGRYNGTVNITCQFDDEEEGWGDPTNAYILNGSERGDGIETRNGNGSWLFFSSDYADADMHFDNALDGVDVHWATEMVYDYYLDKHDRNSYDDEGGKILSIVNYGTDFNNAFWTGFWMVYGSGDGVDFSSFTSLDIVAHEITHAVTDHTADLKYNHESGALNESFSDIFATMIEFAVKSDQANWIIGEDIVLVEGKGGLRSLENPKDPTMLTIQPTTYLGDNWASGGADNGGVHTNSGVQNYWFYLVSEGGSGVNDNDNDYNVSGIGMKKAAEIAYRNLTYYLSKNSTYENAYDGSIDAAIDLYGTNSQEVETVKKAWCAVGLGNCNNAEIELTSFNNGESVFSGSTQYITWETLGFGEDEIRIKLSLDNGDNWEVIEGSTENTGSYEWDIPEEVVTNEALIRVKGVENSFAKDKSSTPFIISDCGVIVDFNLPEGNLCQGTSLIFANSSVGATAYSWKINGLYIQNTFDLHYTFNQPGEYEVQLVGTSNISCSNTITQTITILPTGNADFDYFSSAATLYCTPSLDGATSYAWAFGDGTTSSGNYAIHEYAISGTYNVCLTITTDCSVLQNCEQVQIVLENNSSNIFQQTLGRSSVERANGFVKTDDNHTVIVGRTKTYGSGSNDVVLTKINEEGEEIWSKVYGGSDDDYGQAITQTPDGGFAIVGYTESYGYGKKDLYALKTDASGNLVWSKHYGGNDDDIGSAIINTPDGGLLFGGITESMGAGDDDAFLIKTDINGTTQWQKTVGSSEDEELRDIVAVSGGYVLVGSTDKYDNSSELDVLLAKVTTSGYLSWTKVYGGAEDEEGYSVINASDGGLIVAGYTKSVGAGDEDGYLFKTNANGEKQWEKTFGGDKDDVFYDVKYTSNSGLIISGYSASFDDESEKGYLVKLDASANLEWAKVYGGNSTDAFQEAQENEGGGYTAVGYTKSFGAGSYDMYIVQTDENGVGTDCNEYATTTIAQSSNMDYDGVSFYNGSYSYGGNINENETTISLTKESLCLSADFSFQNTCVGETVVFESTVQSLEANYVWSVDALEVTSEVPLEVEPDVIQGPSSLTYSFDNPGTYMISLTVYRNGRHVQEEHTIIVFPSASMLDLGEDIFACEVPSITLNAGLLGMDSYKWTLNGTQVLGTELELIVTSSGIYELTVVDICGNTKTEEVELVLSEQCVWAGDYNNDNIVDMYDVLYVGYAYGSIGTERPNASTNWEGQATPDWKNEFHNGLNHKFADGNGDGVINDADMDVIYANYGLIHGNLSQQSYVTYTPLSIIATVDSIGTTENQLALDFYLDNELDSTINLYGIAFNFSAFSPSALFSDVTLDFDDWIGIENVNLEVLTYIDNGQTLVGERRVDAAATRNDQTEANSQNAYHNSIGQARLARGVIIIEDLPFGDTITNQLSLNVGGPLLTMSNGDSIFIDDTRMEIFAGQGAAFALTSTTSNCQRSGTAKIQHLAGVGPYTYQWRNGETTKDANSLNLGVHTVTITDALFKKHVGHIEIKGTESITLTPARFQHEINGQANGQVIIQVAGGSGNFDIQWDNGQTGAMATNLSAGNHLVTVMDDSGCIAHQVITIEESDGLVDLTAYLQPNHDVWLRWETQRELNNHYFEIQRSIDGTNYETLGRVEGAGTTNYAREYDFIDEEALTGQTNYYRLKLVSFDQQEMETNVEQIKLAKLVEGINVYPNPAREKVTFHFDLQDEEAVIAISDIYGKVVRKLFVPAYSKYVDLDISTLISGTYFVSVNGGVLHTKFIVIDED